ncbi:hypothetical protein BGZ65_000766, partial [Modicella reniformis]
MVSDTSLGDNSTSVASFDNIYGHYFSYRYGDISHPYTVAKNYSRSIIDLPNSATLSPLLDTNSKLLDGCESSDYEGINVTGKVVLTIGKFDRCGSSVRGVNAKNAGAAAMLIQTVPFGMQALAGIDGFPMAAIENKAGDDLLEAYKKNPNNTFTWNKNETNFLVEGGGAPSGFSSYGLDGDLRSKPDI